MSDMALRVELSRPVHLRLRPCMHVCMTAYMRRMRGWVWVHKEFMAYCIYSALLRMRLPERAFNLGVCQLCIPNESWFRILTWAVWQHHFLADDMFLVWWSEFHEMAMIMMTVLKEREGGWGRDRERELERERKRQKHQTAKNRKDKQTKKLPQQLALSLQHESEKENVIFTVRTKDPTGKRIFTTRWG